MSAKRFRQGGIGGAYTDDAAPQPIGVDPAQTGAFRTIRRGQGAVLSTRKTSARAAKAARTALPDVSNLRIHTHHAPSAKIDSPHRAAPSRPPLAVIIALVAGAALISIATVMFAGALLSPSDDDAHGDVASPTAAAMTTVGAGNTIEYAGAEYGVLEGEDGGWTLTRSSGDETSVIYEFSGMPLTVSLYEGELYITENLPDETWDVIAYMLADGALPSQLVGADGQPVAGDAELSSAVLDGNTLVLTTSSGATVVVPLS